jgi:hypothetical protein
MLAFAPIIPAIYRSIEHRRPQATYGLHGKSGWLESIILLTVPRVRIHLPPAANLLQIFRCFWQRARSVRSALRKVVCYERCISRTCLASRALDCQRQATLSLATTHCALCHGWPGKPIGDRLFWVKRYVARRRDAPHRTATPCIPSPRGATQRNEVPACQLSQDS